MTRTVRALGVHALRGLFLAAPLMLLTCNTAEPPPPGEALMELEALDASCTEAWLRITLKAGVQPRLITLRRDTALILTATLSTSDTTIVDEGLLPNRSYTYTLTRPAGLFTERATETVTTMDTTSHNWSFSIDTLGVTASTFYDVAILSDSNVWAVGELFLTDSVGQLDPILYNAAHWDGTRWNIIRIPYMYQGSPTYGVIRYVFALSENDIWFGNSTHWNGQQFHNVNIGTSVFYGVGSNKMWGSPDGKLYVVGNNGTIAYSPDRGGTWQRVQSGTTADVKDIWGATNSSGESVILCAVSNQFEPGDRRVLRITPQGTVDSLSWRTDRRAASIWFTNESRLFVCGGGVFIRRLDGAWIEQTTVPLYYTYRIRGVTTNDVFVAGGFGLVAHFNGVGWRVWENLGAFIWYSAAYSDNTLVAVGQTSNRGVVLRMRR